jgi:hypothetical protein
MSEFDEDYIECKKGNVAKTGNKQAKSEYVKALKREKESWLR